MFKYNKAVTFLNTGQPNFLENECKYAKRQHNNIRHNALMYKSV